MTLVPESHFDAARRALDTPKADFIGGFEKADPNCAGCGKPLTLANAWMTDGCPCNTPLGVNNANETRWRLLMQLQQNQSFAGDELRKVLEDTKTQFFVGSATRTRINGALAAWSKRNSS